MKKWKRLLVSLLTVSMTLGASTMSVMADDTTPYTYKVTLSAGNKGTINGQNKIEQANIAPDSTVTFNLNDIQVTDDKYYVKGIRLSGRDNASSELLNTPGFIVKGDANEEKDMNPIPYNNYIGKVKLSVPVVGGIAQAATGTAGKIAAASIIGLAVILEIVAAMLDRRDDEDE